MILQLNPQIPVNTPKWPGEAFLVIDYSKEDDLLMCVALDSNGEIWIYPTKDLRFLKNITLGRTLDHQRQLSQDLFRAYEYD